MLVVDDEAPIRLLCRVNLEAEGFDVIEAADGPTGIEGARTRLPAIILLDIMLPVLNGLDVAKELRKDAKTDLIPIIFLTPRIEFCQCVKELDLGDIDCISEPFNPLELASFVREVLKQTIGFEQRSPDRLEALWALKGIASTPNNRSVENAVGRWKKRWM